MSDDFIFEKSKNSNVLRSIRFDEKLHDEIVEVVEEANKGKSKKEYSFNGFVVSACRFALDKMKKK